MILVQNKFVTNSFWGTKLTSITLLNKLFADWTQILQGYILFFFLHIPKQKLPFLLLGEDVSCNCWKNRLKTVCIYNIRMVSSWRLLSALINCFKVACGMFGQSNMHCIVYSVYSILLRPVSKELNVAKLNCG